MGGLTGGLEKYKSLIMLCLAKNRGGLGKTTKIHDYREFWKHDFDYHLMVGCSYFQLVNGRLR